MSITILAADGDVNKVTVDGIEWTYMVLSEANKTCKIGISELKYSETIRSMTPVTIAMQSLKQQQINLWQIFLLRRQFLHL